MTSKRIAHLMATVGYKRLQHQKDRKRSELLQCYFKPLFTLYKMTSKRMAHLTVTVGYKHQKDRKRIAYAAPTFPGNSYSLTFRQPYSPQGHNTT